MHARAVRGKYSNRRRNWYLASWNSTLIASGKVVDLLDRLEAADRRNGETVRRYVFVGGSTDSARIGFYGMINGRRMNAYGHPFIWAKRKGDSLADRRRKVRLGGGGHRRSLAADHQSPSRAMRNGRIRA